MGRPVGARDTEPRMYQGRIRSKDNESYNLPDSGCEKATEYLGEQSACLRCPFEVCQLDTARQGKKAKLTQAT